MLRLSPLLVKAAHSNTEADILAGRLDHSNDGSMGTGIGRNPAAVDICKYINPIIYLQGVHTC